MTDDLRIDVLLSSSIVYTYFPQIKAFGLNRMDIMQREGRYPVPKGASSILGVEFSGHVSELGNGVSGWNEGDEVLGLAGGVSMYL